MISGKRIDRNESPSGLRSYGPGKFDSIVDSVVWTWSLDGWCDDEAGGDEGGDWYGLIVGDLTPPEGDEEAAILNATERAFLACYSAAILHTDSQGFVDVEYYRTAEEAREDWEAIQAETSIQEC